MRYIPLLILSIVFIAANLITSTYNKPKKKQRLLVIPPRALLFGRIEGKEISIEGPYELEYPTQPERKRWKQKGKKGFQTADKKGKNTLIKLLTNVKTTK